MKKRYLFGILLLAFLFIILLTASIPTLTGNAIILGEESPIYQMGSELDGPGECADGIDNDGDGLIDFGNDLSCVSYDDSTEQGITGQIENGWTNIEPSQDTRIIYVSSSQGDDDNDGLTSQTPKQTIAAGRSLTRDGYPDWILLRRGDHWYEGITLTSSGRSASEPAVIGPYGNPQDMRPEIRNAGVTMFDPGNMYLGNLAIIGISFYNEQKDPNSVNYNASYPWQRKAILKVNDGDNLLLEDNLMRFYFQAISIDNDPNTNITLRRNTIIDQYTDDAGHSNGIYLSEMGEGYVTLEENLFDHNGWNEEVMQLNPGTGIGAPTIFRHNVYLQYNSLADFTIKNNIFARSGSHSLQMRSGGVAEDNLFLNNSIALLLAGDTAHQHTPTAKDNVILYGKDISPTFPRGYGIDVESILGANIENNIIAQGGGNQQVAFEIESDNIPSIIHNNVIYNWSGIHPLTYYSNPPGITFTNNVMWNTPSFGSNINYLQANLPDPARDIATYMQFLGETPTLEKFLENARKQQKGNWNENYTAKKVNEYIREGYGKQTTREIPNCTSITQYGITWNFTPTECGQFINGDWWIIEPVNITSKTPAPTSNPARNGDWINPEFRSGSQPFDDRINPSALGPPYDPQLRPVYPMQFDTTTYPKGASLASVISHNTPQDCSGGWRTFTDTGTAFNQNCNRGPLQTAAVLTILPTIPPTNAFRPPYNTQDKTIQFTKEDINYTPLASMAPVGTITTYTLEDVKRHIERVNLQTNFWSSEIMNPSNNANGYGRDLGTDMSIVALMLNLNSFTNAEKEPLMISFLQIGIDFYSVYNNSAYLDTGTYYGQKTNAAWYGLGGHGQGRFFPILFAGEILNNQEMKQIGVNLPNDYYFSELAQTFEVTDYTGTTPPIGGYIDLKDLLVHDSYCSAGGPNCNQGGYTQIDIGLPEFGFSHYHDPMADNRSWGANPYRRCCSANAWGGYLLASHAMNLVDSWNSQTLFDYMDRYMKTTASTGASPVAPGEEWHRGWDQSLYEMWDAYRNNYGCEWEPDDPNNLYSQGHYNCNGQNVRCQEMATTTGILVTACSQYPNQRAIAYDPCQLGCSGTPTQNPNVPTLTAIRPNNISNQESVDISFTGTRFNGLTGPTNTTNDLIFSLLDIIPLNDTLIRMLARQGYEPGNYSLQIRDFGTGLNSNIQQLTVTTAPTTPTTLDTDLDGVPNTQDQCPRTRQANHQYVSQINGCPIPSYGQLSQALSTNFSNLQNPNVIENLILAMSGYGQIHFTETTSLTQFEFGYVYQREAIDLQNNLQFTQNAITLDSGNLPGLNKSANVTIQTTGITNPVIKKGQNKCETTECVVTGFNPSTGQINFSITGWSTYNITQGTCGDNYCSITETEQICQQDCEINTNNNPNGGTGGGGGSSGGTGGGGGTSTPIKINLDEETPQTTTATINKKIELTTNGKVYFIEITNIQGEETELYFEETEQTINAKQLRLYSIDLDKDQKEDIELFTQINAQSKTITFAKMPSTALSGAEEKAKKENIPTETALEFTENFKPGKIGLWIIMLGTILLILIVYSYSKRRKKNLV